MKKKYKHWPAGVLAVFMIGLWQTMDVRSAIAACGDDWLLGGYRLLLAAVFVGLVILGGCFFESLQKKEHRLLRIETIYLIAGLLLGGMYLFVLPPLSAPDEISHYISAYQLSSKMLGTPSTAGSGRVLLRPQDVWVEDLEGIREYETDEDGNLEWIAGTEDANISLGKTLDESVYQLIHEVGVRGQYDPDRLAEMETKLVSSAQPPVVTTPLAYVPQAIGVSVGRLLQTNTLMLLYLGRLTNLLFFVGLTYLAMRRLPFGKEVLFGVAMLPMTLHLSASFSYDVMIMACMFCFTAICLDLACAKDRVRVRDVVCLMLLIAVAGPCKMVYAPMLGLCLLIPVRKFGGWGRWALAALAVGGAWAIAMYAVNSQILTSYATEAESYVQWAAEPGYSLTLLLHQPQRLVRMFYQTLMWQGEQYHLSMIGAWLGNLDRVLDVPYLVVGVITLCLLELAFRKPGESLQLSGKQRIWIGVICAACAAVVMLSMLIACTPLSARVINGVQGRYFLPFLPVLLMALKNDTVVLTKDRNRSILYLMCCLNGYELLHLYSIVSMRL
ncbi:MAG: DUF2142 domain-containing protein [Lachnospiraceae bacterium]|nr:DUF2142 domain-containing protein [Lachnospiraceae bacterium]